MTNEDRLVKLRLQGSVVPPLGGAWQQCRDGVSRMVPGVGGITLNVKVGDPVNFFVGDHLEPGVSTSMAVGSEARTGSRENTGYSAFSCVGNDAVIISGEAKGSRGVVTGHHGGLEHVIVDFADTALEMLSFDDKIAIDSYGVGLEVIGFEKFIRVYALDPRLFHLMNVTENCGRLCVGVAKIIPACVMGSGLGSGVPFKGDYDIQLSDPECNHEFGLDELRLGDVVAIQDHDSTNGWSFRKGALSVGVITHGDSLLAGHGPGCQTILTSASGAIEPIIDCNANIGYYLRIGRFR